MNAFCVVLLACKSVDRSTFCALHTKNVPLSTLLHAYKTTKQYIKFLSMNLSSLLKFGHRGALLLLVFWYLVGSFVYVGSCNLIGQYIVFSSFPRLNVKNSRSKKRLGHTIQEKLKFVALL